MKHKINLSELGKWVLFFSGACLVTISMSLKQYFSYALLLSMCGGIIEGYFLCYAQNYRGYMKHNPDCHEGLCGYMERASRTHKKKV